MERIAAAFSITWTSFEGWLASLGPTRQLFATVLLTASTTVVVSSVFHSADDSKIRAHDSDRRIEDEGTDSEGASGPSLAPSRPGLFGAAPPVETGGVSGRGATTAAPDAAIFKRAKRDRQKQRRLAEAGGAPLDSDAKGGDTRTSARPGWRRRLAREPPSAPRPRPLARLARLCMLVPVCLVAALLILLAGVFVHALVDPDALIMRARVFFPHETP